MSILSNAIKAELADREILTADFKIGGQTTEVAAYPLSPADFIAVNKVCERPFQTDPTQFEGQVEMLIRKTRMRDVETGNATENKAFDIADRPSMMLMGVDVISGMFAELFKDQVTPDEEGEEVTPKGNS